MTQEKKHPHQEKAKADIRLDTSFREWILSGITGVVSGIVAATATIRREFNKEVEFWPEIGDYFAKYDSNGKGIGDKIPGMQSRHAAELNQCDHKYKYQPNTLKEHLAEKTVIKRRHATEFKNLLHKAYEIKTEGAEGVSWIDGFISGTHQRYKSLGPSTKDTVIFAGISTAIIVGVTTLGLFNGVITRNKTNKIAEAVAPEEKSR